jgi:putative FmdB family regulatory protein
MPVYDYKCNSCGRTYDVFHKVREVIDDVVCPSCESTEHTRLLSAPNVAVGKYSSMSVADNCSTGGGCCGGGSCGLD